MNKDEIMTWSFQCPYCSMSLNYVGRLSSEQATRLTCPICQSLLEVSLSVPSTPYPEQYEVTARVVRMGPPQVSTVLVGSIFGALFAGGVGAILGAFIAFIVTILRRDFLRTLWGWK